MRIGFFESDEVAKKVGSELLKTLGLEIDFWITKANSEELKIHAGGEN